MKIAIDVQTMRVPERVGMGSYVANLVSELKRLGGHQYELLAPSPEHDLSSIERFWWDQVRFPRAAAREQVDIIHQPAFSCPIWPSSSTWQVKTSKPARFSRRPKRIVTVHDLIGVHFPENMPLGSRLFFSKWMPYTYRFADAIICDSEATKSDLLQALPTQLIGKPVKVVHLAADQAFAPISDKERLQRIKNKYRTGQRFLLHVGTIEPRKNLEFLVRVFGKLLAHQPLCPLNLVITGKKGWYYQGLFELVKELGLVDRVIFTGYVPLNDMPALYSAADLFVFPSQYEGFGLPPLESMQSGTPVIVANNSSLPEVVGEAGLLVATSNLTEWVKAIERLIERPALAKKLAQAGLKRARQFSWHKTAESTLELYNSLQ